MTQALTNFKLDTSGVVCIRSGDTDRAGEYVWSDPSPFMQGYVEAMFAGPATWTEGRCLTRLSDWAHFSSLAPETLVRIMEDCEDACTRYLFARSSGAEGADYWNERQDGGFVPANHQPQTAVLNDDGKVVFQ